MSWRNEQVSKLENEKLLMVARDCLEIKGDFVEFGCYEGDRSLLLAEVLHKFSTTKKLWVYDSFEGLPEKSPLDESASGEDFQMGVLAASKRDFKMRFLRANLPLPKIVKGWFREVEAANLPEKIAFAFIDGDFYESTKDALKLVTPRMAKGGMILVHDYNSGALPGVTKAVDEWAKRQNLVVSTYQTLAIVKTESRNE